MVSEWRRVRLGDYTDSALGKMLDAQKNKGTPHPYLGNSNVRWGAFDLSSLSSMKFEEDEDERYGIRDGDLIVCEGGEPGRCAIWRGQVPDMKIQKALHRIRSKEGLSNHYLFYWFMLAGRMGWLEPFFTGTTIKHLTGKALKELEVPLPSIDEQRAIAHILGALDDKIELNRKQNETLEAMARAMFKAWFVDFEPVRAKMEGRWQRGQSLPGLPAHLYDIFPERLIESELGKIPQGWEVSTLGKVSSYLSRGISPKYIDAGGVLVLNQKCIRGFSIDVSKGRRHDITQRGVDGRALEVGDVLVNSTGVGTLGRVAQVRRLAEMTVVDSHVTVVRSGARTNPMYLGGFMCMKQPEIEAMGDGSTGQTELSRTKLGAMEILIPPMGVLEEYAKLVGAMAESQAQNQDSSEALVSLRDTLLPKLISGELRVPDATRVIGAVL